MTPTEANSIYKVSPNAVFETFDDEVIIINMISGNYFALDEVALGIWTLLQDHTSLEQVIATTGQRYEGDTATIAASVQQLVAELEQEGLIVRAEAGSTPAPVAAPSGDGTRPAFQKPTVTKFTDMQDLLLVDPIHEVNELGWPHAKVATAPEQ